MAETVSKHTAAASKDKESSVVMLFIGLMVTMLMSSINQTVFSTALPTIVGDLGGVEQMSWVITGYILASTIVMPVYGRISDQFGRKPVLLTAISIFVGSSIIGALAENIWWLVVARVVQGIGGGGLMILSQAAIADVVPARERGKYMGIMGGVFAISSVAGPLLGGWITDGPGWRWAFWMNLPLGALAIIATIMFLHLPKKSAADKARIDYLGMILMAIATTALVLTCTWGGDTYAWNSPQILGLIAVAVISALAFVFTEMKASQPVIPLYFFKDANFTLTTVAGLFIGVAMFGALGYFPTYLQMVTGVGATEAGYLMIPMMGAMLITSVVIGQVVSRTGKYKAFPIVGTAIMTLGLVLLSGLPIDAPLWRICASLAVFGIGLGMGQQILALIVQNSFPNSVVGTATAATNYFRQVGASVGSAVVGSLFISRLHDNLFSKLPDLGATGGASPEVGSLTPAAVSQLPDALRTPIIESYSEALLPIFLFMVPLTVITFILLCFVKEKPLATTVENEIVAESIAEGQLAEDKGSGSAASTEANR